MKLIEPKVELLQQGEGLVGMYKHIERCARTCYKSEDKITEDSYKKMYDNLVQRGHLAMLEHGTIYAFISEKEYDKQLTFNSYLVNQCGKHYSRVLFKNEGVYITTNLRVIIEKHIEPILDFICEPTKFHERRITLKFTTNIGVTREGNRHRVNSIAEQSTRYCNYSFDKFNNEISYTIPTWLSKEQLGNHNSKEISLAIQDLLNCGNYAKKEYAELIYLKALADAECSYLKLIELGWSPQQAREVLPLATKSEVVYTAFVSDWKHWFDLRLVGNTGKPHPNMEEVAWLAKEELVKNNLWNLIYNPNKIII